MKRNVSRSAKLPPFKLDLAKLEFVVAEIRELFPSREPRLNLTLYVRDDDFAFDSLEDLKENLEHLPNRVTHLYLSAIGDGRLFRIRTRFVGGVECDAEADSDVWCAGALTLARRVANENRRWYWLLRPRYFFIAAILTGSLPLILQLSLGVKFDAVASAAWLLVSILFWVLYFSAGRLIPDFTLAIRSDENWLRQYSTELTLLLSLIALIVSVVALIA